MKPKTAATTKKKQQQRPGGSISVHETPPREERPPPFRGRVSLFCFLPSLLALLGRARKRKAQEIETRRANEEGKRKGAKESLPSWPLAAIAPLLPSLREGRRVRLPPLRLLASPPSKDGDRRRTLVYQRRSSNTPTSPLAGGEPFHIESETEARGVAKRRRMKTTPTWRTMPRQGLSCPSRLLFGSFPSRWRSKETPLLECVLKRKASDEKRRKTQCFSSDSSPLRDPSSLAPPFRRHFCFHSATTAMKKKTKRNESMRVFVCFRVSFPHPSPLPPLLPSLRATKRGPRFRVPFEATIGGVEPTTRASVSLPLLLHLLLLLLLLGSLHPCAFSSLPRRVHPHLISLAPSASPTTLLALHVLHTPPTIAYSTPAPLFHALDNTAATSSRPAPAVA